MYRILHILSGEFVYRGEYTNKYLTIIGCNYMNIRGHTPIYDSYYDAIEAIKMIVAEEKITFWAANGVCEIIKNPLKAEFEIIEIEK